MNNEAVWKKVNKRKIKERKQKIIGGQTYKVSFKANVKWPQKPK